MCNVLHLPPSRRVPANRAELQRFAGAYFRRSLTAAPLKLELGHQQAPDPWVFPPFTNGGPIEAIACLLVAKLASAFPPFTNGGPIEANPATMSRRSPRLISAVH